MWTEPRASGWSQAWRTAHAGRVFGFPLSGRGVQEGVEERAGKASERWRPQVAFQVQRTAWAKVGGWGRAWCWLLGDGAKYLLPTFHSPPGLPACLPHLLQAVLLERWHLPLIPRPWGPFSTLKFNLYPVHGAGFTVRHVLTAAVVVGPPHRLQSPSGSLRRSLRPEAVSLLADWGAGA